MGGKGCAGFFSYLFLSYCLFLFLTVKCFEPSEKLFFTNKVLFDLNHLEMSFTLFQNLTILAKQDKTN